MFRTPRLLAVDGGFLASGGHSIVNRYFTPRVSGRSTKSNSQRQAASNVLPEIVRQISHVLARGNSSAKSPESENGEVRLAIYLQVSGMFLLVSSSMFATQGRL